MKTKALSIILLALVISCQGKKSVDYANSLVGLNKEDVELLNSLTYRFEELATNVYGKDVEKAYFQYLQDLANNNLPLHFFRYSAFKSDLERLRASSFYESEMVPLSLVKADEELTEIPPTPGYQKNEAPFETMVFNPKGAYIKSLIQLNKVKVVSEYLQFIEKGVDLSPSLLAKTLINDLTIAEMQDPIVRLIISVNFHYGLGLLITETS